ncbi:conserved hypothetical protein [Alkaliphilus metalliredigens QYMF]|uniref:DinB-like domain-containing protein n=1 Tax=Alkaliphilus metalliredigens (strain QYMF) TaxID=293826 RepID=A6TPE3_ALKMQ|nr:DinB family protein [Alkaliphilus metalliredigens]ABR48061.1 conserved hypothetical protein [Alkaliphilus metalliredigens QYMF]
MSDDNSQNSIDSLHNAFNFQLDISWQMLQIHLKGLGDEECLWRPSSKGLHVVNELGIWKADWPDSEDYDIGPSSIAWITWHIIFWWSMVFDYSFGNGTLTREDIHWPGDMIVVREKIKQLYDDWKNRLAMVSDEEFLSCEKTKWPFEERPLYELAAWLNLELMKNASEIGYCRFLYASRKY